MTTRNAITLVLVSVVMVTSVVNLYLIRTRPPAPHRRLQISLAVIVLAVGGAYLVLLATGH